MHFRCGTYKAARAPTTACQSSAVRSDDKMRLFGLLVLFLLCELVAPVPVSNADDVSVRRVPRSPGIGETVRDWIRTMRDRIVGKWHEWFGEDSPSLSAQDILNIDKKIEGRLSGYPGLFLDLSDLSFDPKQDWGVRVGNWYVIRKIIGDSYNPHSEEWDAKLPVPPNYDWVSNVFEVPQVTQPPTTTSKIGPTTTGPQTIPRTESVLPSTESTVFTTEPTVTTDQQTLFTTQLISTSSELTSRTQGAVTSSEFFPTDNGSVSTESTSTESIATSTEPIATSTESIATFTEPTIESTAIPIESIIPSTDAIPISTVSNTTSGETTVTTVGSTIVSTEETATITTAATESPATTTFVSPIFNKRVEDNETVDRRTTKKPRPASAEVIID